MKRILKWGSLAVVLLVVIVVAVVYFRINSIVKYAVETQGSKQMNLKTELDGASLSLFGGEVGLDDLKIANPPGFTAEHLFTLDGIDVKVPIRELRANPKRISLITIDQPKLVIERSADGKFNFKTAIDQMPKPSEPTEPTPSEPAGEEMKVIIDELNITGATVLIRPGINLPGIAKEITVPIPAFSMKNIGNAENAQNGAALRDVAQQVITVMAANASNSELIPAELRGLLSLDVNAITAELGKRLGAEAQKRIAAAVPGELGKQLGAVLADPNALIKDPGKALDAVKDNIGLPTTIPSDPKDLLKDPAKAAEGLQGLLGSRKKDKEKNPTTQNEVPK